MTACSSSDDNDVKVCDDTKSQQEHEQLQPQPLRLIDVDCNLWHRDLPSLLFPASSSQSKTDTSNNDDVNNIPECFHILKQDNVQDIVAMISPSSTIREAQRGVQYLHIWNEYHRCQVHQSDTAITLEDSSCIDDDNNGSTAPATNGDDSSLSSTKWPNIAIWTTVGVHPYHVNDDNGTESDTTIDNHANLDHVNSHRSNNNGDAAGITNSLHDKLRRHMEQARQLLLHEQQQQTSMINSNSNPTRKTIVAIGECGLDGSEGFPPLQDQIPWFQQQIELAIEFQLPLFVHERLAFEETCQLLPVPLHNNNAALDKVANIIIHCFTGTKEQCRVYIERGYYISISGYIFRPDAQEVQESLQAGIIPLDKLMIETDAPYMGFASCRELYVQHNIETINKLKSKQRKSISTSKYPNPPSSLKAVLYQVLHYINLGRIERNEPTLTPAELAQYTSDNANTFFGLGL